MADVNCAHDDCDCIVRDGKGIDQDGETFCSRFCANIGTEGSTDECKCGHADLHMSDDE